MRPQGTMPRTDRPAHGFVVAEWAASVAKALSARYTYGTDDRF
jgi:hypothetical protein